MIRWLGVGIIAISVGTLLAFRQNTIDVPQADAGVPVAIEPISMVEQTRRPVFQFAQNEGKNDAESPPPASLSTSQLDTLLKTLIESQKQTSQALTRLDTQLNKIESERQREKTEERFHRSHPADPQPTALPKSNSTGDPYRSGFGSTFDPQVTGTLSNPSGNGGIITPPPPSPLIPQGPFQMPSDGGIVSSPPASGLGSQGVFQSNNAPYTYAPPSQRPVTQTSLTTQTIESQSAPSNVAITPASAITGSVGYSIWGQPTLYLDNQPVRNFLKSLFGI